MLSSSFVIILGDLCKLSELSQLWDVLQNSQKLVNFSDPIRLFDGTPKMFDAFVKEFFFKNRIKITVSFY